MKKIISIVGTVIIAGSVAVWKSVDTKILKKTEHVFNKGLKKSSSIQDETIIEAFKSSSLATKKIFREMNIPPKDIQKILSRFSQKDLIILTEKMKILSSNAKSTLYSDLARKSDNASIRFVNAINEKPEILKSYQSIFSDMGVKFRTNPQVLSDILNNVSPIILKTTNYNNVGKVIEGIPLVKRILSINGIKFKGVFPDFDKVSKCNVSLPKNLFKKGDDEQMKYATKFLKKQLNKNPNKLKEFSKKQIAAIYNGRSKIPDLTWHHKEAPKGAMQLVSESIHNKIGHDGGKTFWNGGNR